MGGQGVDSGPGGVDRPWRCAWWSSPLPISCTAREGTSLPSPVPFTVYSPQRPREVGWGWSMALWIVELNAVGGWDVRREGATSRAARVPDRASATKRAVELATKAGGGRVVVHGARQQVIEEIDVAGSTTGASRSFPTKGQDVSVQQNEFGVRDGEADPPLSAKPQHHNAPRQRGKGAVEIQELVEGYGLAASQIAAIPDLMEREVAQAALRLNAAATLSHVTRDGGIKDDAIQPLQKWVSGYVGGERAEKLVAFLERKAAKYSRKVIYEVLLWAVAGKAIVVGVGVLGTIAGVILFFVDTGYSFMSALLVGAIPAGAVSLMIRSAAQNAPAFTQAVQTTWGQASQLGSDGLGILHRTTLDLERRVWALSGGAHHRSVPFVIRARLCAQGVVGGVIALCIVGMSFFVFGAFNAYNDWEQQQSGRPFGISPALEGSSGINAEDGGGLGWRPPVSATGGLW